MSANIVRFPGVVEVTSTSTAGRAFEKREPAERALLWLREHRPYAYQEIVADLLFDLMSDVEHDVPRDVRLSRQLRREHARLWPDSES